MHFYGCVVAGKRANGPSKQSVLPRGKQCLFVGAVLREAKLLQLQLFPTRV